MILKRCNIDYCIFFILGKLENFCELVAKVEKTRAKIGLIAVS